MYRGETGRVRLVGGKVEGRFLTSLNGCGPRSGPIFPLHLNRTSVREFYSVDHYKFGRGLLGEPSAISDNDLDLDPVYCIYGRSCILCTMEKIEATGNCVSQPAHVWVSVATGDLKRNVTNHG